MKKVLAIMFVAAMLLTMSFCLIGCNSASTSTSEQTPIGSNGASSLPGLEYIGSNYPSKGSSSTGHAEYADYYRDVITDVMYLYCKGYNNAGLTVMLDPETGKPLTYTRYMELYRESVNFSVGCPGCEKEFDTDSVPAFCPVCGTKVKE